MGFQKPRTPQTDLREVVRDRKTQVREALRLVGERGLSFRWGWWSEAWEDAAWIAKVPTHYDNTTAHVAEEDPDRRWQARPAVCGHTWYSGGYQARVASWTTVRSHGIVLCPSCYTWLREGPTRVDVPALPRDTSHSGFGYVFIDEAGNILYRGTGDQPLRFMSKEMITGTWEAIRLEHPELAGHVYISAIDPQGRLVGEPARLY